MRRPIPYVPWLHGLLERVLGRSYRGQGGLVRDAPDPRDYAFHILAGSTLPGAPPSTPPASVDLRSGLPPVRDQGPWQSCTAFALTGAMEYLLRKATVGLDQDRYSPAFVWCGERFIEGDPAMDAPCQIRDGLRVLSEQGVCLEAAWPYDSGHAFAQPDQAAADDAGKRKVTLYIRHDGLAELKQGLASGYPVVFGFALYPSMMSNDGNLAMPDPNQRSEGGHAVLAVGYDDAQGRVFFRNSWGPRWGQQGYGSLPYEFFADPSHVWDMWSLRTEQVPELDAAFARYGDVVQAQLALDAALEQQATDQQAQARALLEQSEAALRQARGA